MIKAFRDQRVIAVRLGTSVGREAALTEARSLARGARQIYSTEDGVVETL